MTFLIVVASISAGFGTVVSLNNTIIDQFSYRLFGLGSSLVPVVESI